MTWPWVIVVLILMPFVPVLSFTVTWLAMKFVWEGRFGKRQVWRGLMPREEWP